MKAMTVFVVLGLGCEFVKGVFCLGGTYFIQMREGDKYGAFTIFIPFLSNETFKCLAMSKG